MKARGSAAEHAVISPSSVIRIVLTLLVLAPAVARPVKAQTGNANAASANNCPAPRAELGEALKKSVKASGGPSNGGFDNNEWAVVVGREGKICAVAFSGQKWDDQWPGSRAVAAAKANTANSFSVAQKAIATANLYAGHSLADFSTE